MEETRIVASSKCPICAQKGKVHGFVDYGPIYGLVESYSQAIAFCEICSHVYVPNPVSADVLSDYYSRTSKYLLDADRVASTPLPKRLAAKRQVAFVNSVASDIDSVLEVGSGNGYALSLFAKQNLTVKGVEPSEQNARMTTHQYGIEVYTGTLSDEALSQIGFPYSLVYLSHVLEHIEDLNGFVNIIRKASSDYVFVEVPCFEKQNSDGEPFSFFYEHIQYFTFESLQELFRRHGFDVVALQIRASDDGSFPYFPVIEAVFRKTSSIRKTPRYRGFATVHGMLKEYWNWSMDRLGAIQQAIESIPDSEPVAVWGVGSHTAKLLGMTALRQKNIVLFIDSDTYKQGHTYLAKPIHGYNKDVLHASGVQTILVSTREGESSIREFLRKDSWTGRTICFYI